MAHGGYNERLGYDLNGNLNMVTRNGFSGTLNRFVTIDDVYVVQRNGNRLQEVVDMASNGTSNDLMEFRDVNGGSVEYTYDTNGNMTSDKNRGITKIEYNLLNLPQNVTFANGNTIRYVYDASGVKHMTSHYRNDELISSRAYCRNKVYEGEWLGMVLNEEGYCQYTGDYHFYLKDHLGNNRVVFDKTGAINQVTNYYPFGSVMAESPRRNDQEFQPYKFGGKELDRMFGLDQYDFVARGYYSPLGGFLTMDPLCEKYPWISPYAYCANNPVNAVDLRGDSITTVVTSMVNGVATNTTYYYGQDANGNYGFLDSSGNLYAGGDQFVASLTTAIGNLRGGAKGQALVDDLMNSTNTVQIANRRDNKADPNGKYVLWNPNSTTGGINTMGNENRPSYIGLGHEIVHIQDVWNGTYDASAWVTIGSDVIPNAEKYATHVENQLRAENNISLRTHYGIDASSGTRVGLESTRIIRGGVSTFYMQSNGTVRGIPLLKTPYRYR